MSGRNERAQQPLPTIISHLKDLANLCSLAGLLCTMAALYFSILGNFHAAMIGMIWAVAFDWVDGLVARRTRGRTESDKVFGAQLDSLIDVVNYGVAPAVLLLSYGNFDTAFLPGAFLLVAASALRLSYFNTFGLSGGSHYTGLALDNNNIAIVFIFLFEPFFSGGAFAVLLYVSMLGLAALNVSQIKTAKLSGSIWNVYGLAIYTIGMTGIYSWKLM